MHTWKTIIALVVVFAFGIEFRPLDPFMTTYLTGPRVNITVSQVNIKFELMNHNIIYYTFFIIISF